MNWSKELWFALLFLSVGFTIWPLIIYYLGLASGIEFFLNITLRTWAEEIVYGSLGEASISFLRSLLFLLFPYLAFTFIRIIVSR